jgi:hypothetical protein
MYKYIFLGLQSLSLRFFTAFLHLGKGLCELLFPVPFEMRQPPGKKYKNQPTTSYLPPFISIPPYWRRWAASTPAVIDLPYYFTQASSTRNDSNSNPEKKN